MTRVILPSLVLAVCLAMPLPAQDGEPIGKSISLGPLPDSFTLVSGLVYDEQPAGYKIVLKLKATKDVDTSELHCQVGFFDRGKTIVQASPLLFQANFPLQKGEMVNAGCAFVGTAPEEGTYPWHTIVIRPGKKPG